MKTTQHGVPPKTHTDIIKNGTNSAMALLSNLIKSHITKSSLVGDHLFPNFFDAPWRRKQPATEGHLRASRSDQTAIPNQSPAIRDSPWTRSRVQSRSRAVSTEITTDGSNL